MQVGNWSAVDCNLHPCMGIQPRRVDAKRLTEVLLRQGFAQRATEVCERLGSATAAVATITAQHDTNTLASQAQSLPTKHFANPHLEDVPTNCKGLKCRMLVALEQPCRVRAHVNR